MAFDLYRAALRPFLFSGVNADPEWLHQRIMDWLDWLNTHSDEELPQRIRSWFSQSCSVPDERLSPTLWGISFPNPVGLAAGFDKDGHGAGLWGCVGFGYAELGTVTQWPQPGNPKPRLFRLVQDEAAINRMGFNNQGSEALAERLRQTQVRYPQMIPIGINLGKSKITPLEEAAADYLTSFQRIRSLGDYFVVNVSSPNTPGLRSLQATDQLRPILETLQAENLQPGSAAKPLLVKISPDLDWEAIAAILDLARDCQLAGVIATNTTIQREGLKTRIVRTTGNAVEDEAGGLSGAPLRQRSTEVIRFIYRQTKGQLPIIGVGGIFTAEDAWEKITAGASLVQTYTGWIYEGPWMVRRVLEGLQQKLEAHGLSHISEAVGLDQPIEGVERQNSPLLNEQVHLLE